MAKITEDEIKLLNTFRQNLVDADLQNENTDYDLIRWIRARGYDLNAAEKMLRTSLQWREKNKINELLDWKPDSELFSAHPYHIGRTRSDGVFFVMIMGKVDLKKEAINPERKERFVKYLLRIIEDVMATIRERKNDLNDVPVTQFTVIADLNGLSLTSASIAVFQMMKDFVFQFEANYPERCEQIILVNAPRIMSIFLKFLKTVMSGKTFDKIDVLDADPIKSKEALLGYIEEDELPLLFGGKHVDSPVNCFLEE